GGAPGEPRGPPGRGPERHPLAVEGGPRRGRARWRGALSGRRLAPAPGRRAAEPRALRALGRGAPRGRDLESLRPDRNHRQLRSRASRGRRPRPHRPAHRRHPPPAPGRRAAAGPGRRRGRALRRRRRRRPRLPRPARPDGGALPARSLRGPSRRSPLPHRRPRAADPGRRDRVPRPHRPPGQGPRLPHRAGGDRGPAGAPSGGAGGCRAGGDGARRRLGDPPRRLRRPRRPPGPLRRRPAGRPARNAPRVHGPRRLRLAAPAAAPARRQGRPRRPPALRQRARLRAAVRGAAHRHRAPAGGDLGRGPGPRERGGRGRFLRARRTLHPEHPDHPPRAVGGLRTQPAGPPAAADDRRPGGAGGRRLAPRIFPVTASRRGRRGAARRCGLGGRELVNAARLLGDLDRLGVRLWAEGDRLCYRSPQGSLTPPLLARLREGKAEILELVRRSEPRPARRPAPPLPAIVPDRARRHEPFPLSDIQQAYLVGRTGLFELGGIGPTSYVEVDWSELNLGRLEGAWNRLVERHDVLRAVVDPAGQLHVLPRVPPYTIAVRDLRGLGSAAVAAERERTRERMSELCFDPERWPLFALEASLLDGGLTRLHVSRDLLIGDARSTEILIAELLALYGGAA